MIQNNINLKSNNDGTYDWDFGLQDLNDVNGNQKLKNNIIHAVMLRPYELRQEYYVFEGCSAWDYIHERQTDHTKSLVTDGMKMVITKISGINDADIELTNKGAYNTISRMLLFKDDGTEVEIDGI